MVPTRPFRRVNGEHLPTDRLAHEGGSAPSPVVAPYCSIVLPDQTNFLFPNGTFFVEVLGCALLCIGVIWLLVRTMTRPYRGPGATVLTALNKTSIWYAVLGSAMLVSGIRQNERWSVVVGAIWLAGAAIRRWRERRDSKRRSAVRSRG
ncbi:MAG: hypothetical protein JWR35_1044 [Marmoricola sp.]|nr:hypothetical protein [Marmoricola sp.]